MLAVLRNPTYARLFSAQVIALLGTGLLTVALGLLAFDIAGGNAGVILGIAMAIKMIAYVAVTPVAQALTARLPRKPVLIGADLVRAGVALLLPFISEAWQIYILIFLLQSASAAFTPTFQAVIPSVLPDEGEYTQALSLSRLAYDTEALVSPMLAAALLTVISYHSLFVGTIIGFLASAALVLASRLPAYKAPQQSSFIERLTLGTTLFWSNQELRGLMGLNLVTSTATAMIIINTVVLVQGNLGRQQTDVALLLGASGAGSMLVALLLPNLLEKISDRKVMLTGGFLLPIFLGVTAMNIGWFSGSGQWWMLLALWGLMGAATSMVLTPSARLLRRNSTEENRPAVFAAQFSLSHACYLITYPLAGIVGTLIGLPAVAILLATLGILGIMATLAAWRTTSRTGNQVEVD